MRLRLLAVLAVVAAACAFDFDGYDPRQGRSGGGPAPTSSSTGGAAAGGASAGGALAGGEAPWLDPGLARRRPLEVAFVGAGDASLDDFPVLVVLEGLGDVAPELRFASDDHQTLLAHEIDSWDPAGTSYVWLEVPSLSATPQRLWMYYDGTPSTSGLDAAATWSNGFVAVWHLGEDLVDATGHGHDGVGGAIVVDGLIGQAHLFDGDADFVDVAAAPAFDDLFAAGGTITVWMLPYDGGEVDRGRIIDRTLDTTFGGGFALLMSDYATPGSVGFGYGYTLTHGWWTTPADSVMVGAWQHVGASYLESDSEPALYLEGAAQPVVVYDVPTGEPPAAASVPVRIGGRSGGLDRDFDGILDELRVASVIRSPLWIAAEALASDGGLVTVGAAEERPNTSTSE